MNIAVSGIGYVGLSNAVLLAQHNKVIAFDINPQRVELINERKTPFEDSCIQEFLSAKALRLRATTNTCEAYADADFVIVATPTDYNSETNEFDTTSVDSCISDILSINRNATIIIKSTVPLGYTRSAMEHFKYANIIFSPEFLREGTALHDNLYPSRIVIGSNSDEAHLFASLLQQGAFKKNIPVLFTESTEAEAIKLFSNTYLALRIAYFNELDTYAKSHSLNTRQIIEGVSMDPRIGKHYNNPSFGYGGYCLPKDTRQLLSNYGDIPQHLIRAVIESNSTRKRFLASDIISAGPKTVGVYRLAMKANSDNFRETSITEIIEQLTKEGITVVIYEPLLAEETFMNLKVIKCLNKLKQISDLIIANRLSDELDDVREKVYSRDLYKTDH